MEEQRYNKRVRQAISDKYVEYSKMYADTHKEFLKVESKLKGENAKKKLSYDEYVDLGKYIFKLREEMKVLKIQIDIWDAAREICLDIIDEECGKVKKKIKQVFQKEETVMKSDIIFYKLRFDIVGTDGATTSYDGKSRYNDIEAARSAATRARQSLFEKYFNGEIRDYKVDVIPDNE